MRLIRVCLRCRDRRACGLPPRCALQDNLPGTGGGGAGSALVVRQPLPCGEGRYPVGRALPSREDCSLHIEAISLDTTCCSVCFLDSNFEPLRPCLLWMDSRSSKQCDEILLNCPSLQSKYMMCKVMQHVMQRQTPSSPRSTPQSN
jgi:hypothetical protein